MAQIQTHPNNNRIRSTLTGATTGVVVSVLLIAMIVRDNFALIDPFVLILIAGGFVGGGVVGLLVHTARGYPLLAAGLGMIGGMAGCSLSFLLFWIYSGIAWPSPPLHPTALDVTKSTGGGSWARSQTTRYNTSLSADEIEAYYVDKMPAFCIDEWTFQDVSTRSDERYREAECRIRRIGFEQYFTVQIIRVSAAILSSK